MKRWFCQCRKFSTLWLLASVILSAPAVSAQTLGRLFATPAEREAMEAQRGAASGPTAVAMPATGVQPLPADPNQAMPGATVAMPATPAAAPNTLVMGGSLRSSSGRSTVWLNNVPQSDGQNQFSQRAKQTVSITLPSGKRVLLRAGQRYDLDAGRVKDVNEP